MQCAVRSDLSKDWLRDDLRSVGSDPSSSILCPTICRRAASFPIVSRHHPMSSLLRVRSQSESDALNRLGVINSRTTLTEQLKKRQLIPITVEKSLDNAESISQGQSNANLDYKNFADSNVDDFDQLAVIVENIVVQTEKVIRRLLGETDENKKSSQVSGSWVISFKQPASEYVKFRETLERGFVALENVVLKNEICHMVGTIKVKNITYEKKVFVRFTSDGWKSFLDRMAIYQPSSSKFYDTFSFDVELPTNGCNPNARIEFCICFEIGSSQGDTNQQQFWDSNNGRNYVLISQEAQTPISPLPVSLSFGKHDPNDAYTYEFDDWTKFAAWRNLPTDSPYW